MPAAEAITCKADRSPVTTPLALEFGGRFRVRTLDGEVVVAFGILFSLVAEKDLLPSLSRRSGGVRSSRIRLVRRACSQDVGSLFSSVREKKLNLSWCWVL